MTKSTEVKSKTGKAWFLKEQDVEIDYDPDGNGNCQISAFSHQLLKNAIFDSPEMHRKSIADYLSKRS